MKNSFMIVALLFTSAFTACSSGPEIKQQGYAKLKEERTFEYEFPVVWKAIEETLRGYVITNRDPNKVDLVEMKKIPQRSLETDWVYSRSNEKYVEYKINGSPRKIYLQTRTRYHVTAKTVLGGVEVTVDPQEEVEKLKDDGSSAGFISADTPERTLASAMLDKMGQLILSSPDI